MAIIPPEPNTNVNMIRAALNWHLRASLPHWEGHPANPHDFTPDEDNTVEQLAAHRLACEQYDAGTYEHVDIEGEYPWGKGTMQFDRPEMKLALEALEVLESELAQLRRLAGSRELAAFMRDAARYMARRAEAMSHRRVTTQGDYDAASDKLVVLHQSNK